MKLLGQKGPTAALRATNTGEEVERQERWRSKVFFCCCWFVCFFVHFLFLINIFILLLFIFNVSLQLGEEHYKGERWIWRDWEICGIRVHDVKFSMNQYKNYVF